MSAWGHDDAFAIYHRAFDIADLDPDPDRDYYNPETTHTGTTRPFRLPPVPVLQTGRAIRAAREEREERDELRAALKVALNQRDAARDDLDRAEFWRGAWLIAAYVLGLLLTYSWLLDGR